MNPSQPAVNNPLSAMREGETIICEIKRHPFGLFSMYFSFAALLLIVAVVTLIAPSILTSYDRTTVYEVGSLVFIVAAILVGIFSLIATTVYKGNRWIVTSDSLTQITQRSLFDKQSSQLSLGNLEDITAEQNGILAHLIGFGVLRAETAGERSKFMFMYCPSPNTYAQKILVARENFEQGRRNEAAPAVTTAVPAAPDNGVNINTQ